MDNPDRIHFDCPHCGRAVRAPLELRGKRAKCGSCHQKVSIPIGETESANSIALTGHSASEEDQADLRLEHLPLPQRIDGLNLSSKEYLLVSRWASMEKDGQARCEVLLTTKRIIVVEHPALAAFGLGGFSSRLVCSHSLGGLVRILASRTFLHGNEVEFTFQDEELGKKRLKLHPLKMADLIRETNTILVACHGRRLEEEEEGKWVPGEPPSEKKVQSARRVLAELQEEYQRSARQQSAMRAGKKILVPILSILFSLLLIVIVLSALLR